MGEYAIEQMMRDFKRMTGVNADRSDFELGEESGKSPLKCLKCGRLFRVRQAVTDHMRDKHGITASEGAA